MKFISLPKISCFENSSGNSKTWCNLFSTKKQNSLSLMQNTCKYHEMKLILLFKWILWLTNKMENLANFAVRKNIYNETVFRIEWREEKLLFETINEKCKMFHPTTNTRKLSLGNKGLILLSLLKFVFFTSTDKFHLKNVPWFAWFPNWTNDCRKNETVFTKPKIFDHRQSTETCWTRVNWKED